MRPGTTRWRRAHQLVVVFVALVSLGWLVIMGMLLVEGAALETILVPSLLVLGGLWALTYPLVPEAFG